MNFKKGTYRYALLIPIFSVALKFPRIRFKLLMQSLIDHAKSDFTTWLAEDINTYHSAKWYFKGISDNWLEYRFYRRNKSSSFLQPIYFSLFGLFTIAPLTRELPKNQFIQFLQKLCKLTDDDVSKDGHHFGEHDNFCIYRGYIMMRDYGDVRTQAIITKHLHKLNELTME